MLRLPALCALLLPHLFAAGTIVRFDPSDPSTGPFPNDSLTAFDPSQRTGLRVNLPLPNCATQVTTCQETRLLNQLDGFSPESRARIRFSAPIDTGTLHDGVFFVPLDALPMKGRSLRNQPAPMSTDRIVYDPATNTVYAKPFNVLNERRRYALVVTDAVKDAAGNSVAADPAYQSCLAGSTDYCALLARELTEVADQVAPHRIVAASVFTTMSATAWLEHSRAVLDFVTPDIRMVASFHVPEVATFTIHEQNGVNPTRFSDVSLPLDPTLLSGVDRLVVGSFRSPSFLQPDQTIPSAPTGSELPVPARIDTVYFNLLLPATPEPPVGYPVVIFGHGFGDSRFGGPTAVAPALDRSGFAVIAINAVGHGFGPASTVTLTDTTGKSTTITSGGRSIDLNGDGVIEANEGCTVLSPVAVGPRDCFRQTVLDLMQLARVIRLGVDVDGDGHPDLDAARIYYGGQSLGAIYGTIFTALEPTVRAAALNAGGGSLAEIARWSPAYRDLAVQAMGGRVPSLLNQGSSYDEDYVLTGHPVKVTTVPGAIPIQEMFERLEWLAMSGDPLSFAPHLKLSPLPGRTPRPVLYQFALDDRTMPNPASTLLIRAAGEQQNTWEYRHDLALAKAPDLPLNPHPYLVLFVTLGGSTIQLPGLAGLSISLDAQGQMAGFFQSDGATIADPNVLVRLLLGIRAFEIPAVLPVELGF